MASRDLGKGTQLLASLDALVRDTYALWDEGWVSFNWRAYTYDHVQRVRALAVRLARDSGGDPWVTELAALLHDITKAYDGEVELDKDGKRKLDANGHWHSAQRPPARDNEVTRLYDELGLAGQLHHESGAALAERLLARRGVDGATIAGVSQAIRDHLQPREGAPIASCALYDADTIDANIGLPAFVRNIYINLHFYDARRPAGSPALDDLLREAPLDFLRPYIHDKLPTWSQGKQRDFIPRLMLPASRELSLARLERLADVWAGFSGELGEFERTRERGRLAVLWHYMTHRDDPSISDETRILAEEWVERDGATPEARELVGHIVREAAGDE